MKKIISILIAFAVVLSAISISTISAFAETTTKYWEPISDPQGVAGYVNGEYNGDAIYMAADTENDATRIEYSGEGKVKGWEFPTLTEGKDYKIISQYDNIIIVKFSVGCPYINALVDFGNVTVTEVSKTAAQAKPYTDDAANEKTSSDVTSDNKENTGEEFTMDLTFDLLTDDTPEKTESNGAKTVIIAVAAGAAVCIAVLVVLKIKKSHSK